MQEGTVSVVIFGATGDLARRKLLPGLFSLYCKRRLPEDLRIVGFSRSRWDDGRYREEMRASVQEFADLSTRRADWERFRARLCYQAGDLGDLGDVKGLARRLDELEGGVRPANRLYFLSVSPGLYESAITNLGGSGLAETAAGWRRVVIEKPFGWDLQSAQTLDRCVQRVFRENQVFRIDHYLGKETVQNLLVFRFANSIFEPIWNRNYVNSVQITVAEEVDVGRRGAYYDQSGVVRDMVQNHLLQLLTMVAMEPPSAMDAESLRSKKVDVLKAIRRWPPEEAAKHAVRGQYRGYLDAEGVPGDSTTATYAALRFYVDNWRWEGVPFYLRTGKAMATKQTEILVEFRSPPHLLFGRDDGEEPLMPNVLSFCVQPDEGAHLRFQVKVPDRGMQTRPVEMDFHYRSAFQQEGIPEAYERLLQDAIRGDASLFIRNDHIDEAWRIVDPLIHSWRELAQGRLFPYDRGSWGPAAADDLLRETGHSWLRGCGAH